MSTSTEFDGVIKGFYCRMLCLVPLVRTASADSLESPESMLWRCGHKNKFNLDESGIGHT